MLHVSCLISFYVPFKLLETIKTQIKNSWKMLKNQSFALNICFGNIKTITKVGNSATRIKILKIRKPIPHGFPKLH